MEPASKASPAKKERGKAITNADDAAMLMNKYAMHDYTTDSMPVVPVYVPGTLAQFRASHPHLARTAGKIKLLWRWVYAWGHERFTSAFCVWNQHGFGAWPYGHPMGNKVAASLRLFSTKDNAWVAGIRKEAEQSYVELNRAVARYVHSWEGGDPYLLTTGTAKTQRRSRRMRSASMPSSYKIVPNAPRVPNGPSSNTFGP